MKKLNLKSLLITGVSATLTAAIAIGGTLAYLTDRDSEANVFTVGDVKIELNEEFDQGANLLPGVEIEKKPTITNTGKNDAWVWMTFSIPAALDNWNPESDEGSNENVIHWNPLGATTVGKAAFAAGDADYSYVTETRVTNAITAGHLPEGSTAEDITTNNKTWNVFNNFVDGGNAFEGKPVKLGVNVDLAALDADGEAICFVPIGSYRNATAFKETFDGQDHTIKNMSQNTWALDNGYYYGDLGLGLFGLVEYATVKDLTMDNASISGESAMCGTVAAAAYGDCTFENIIVTNSEVADYQYYAGGIVGWASGNHQYINCEVTASTTIAAQWGDFDNSIGGVIGGAGGSATIYMKDCNVACRIDAYNNVTSSYQWYAYRRCGMLIGNTGKTVDDNSTTRAAAPQLTCENVTVTYGEWANYTYCEFAGKNWPYVRVQEGVSNSAYSNPRYGHPTDANGNEVVDDNHVHNDGEDHFIECTFDQLYGGGQGVYGGATHDGVTVVYNNK